LQLIDFIKADKDLPISGVTSDSRQVRKNYLFAALSGTKMDGGQFISDAIHHGASLILADEGTALPEGAPEHVQIINDKNPRQAFAKIAAKFYKIQPENIVAVTGTSGKTSTVSFIQQIWHLSGITKCASLGTLGLRGPGMRRYGGLTTPDTQGLHAELADLASAGINHLAMEASSHGLDQYRLDGVKVKAAAYTNLSRDHLDYHNDMDEYFMAKARLFSELLEKESVAVINADDEYAGKLIEICRAQNHQIISFGYEGEDIKLIKRVPKPDGQDIKISIAGKVYDITLPLVGEFQVMNALCALGLVLSQDNNPEKYIPTLEKLRGVAGRLQLVSGHPKGSVYVDYAHKPAALEAVLKTLRPHTENNLVCVFGCGGNRDAGKRALMGGIANELADKVIVTDDNPRYEEPAAIREQILDAVPKAVEMGDRAQAIQRAVEELQEGDVLVIAGKGHEQGQIVGDKVHAFDDVEEVKKSIKKVS
jgi:UDP-N-acetylmuramoyl-L-alanyl-D-glutamate--2,6-diaminopimelate ligase